MKNLHKFYINGQWVEPISDLRMDVINPATENSIGQITLGSAEDMASAISAAKSAFTNYSKTSTEERITLLEKLLAIYNERYEEMAQAISAEMGATIDLSMEAQTQEGVGHLQGILDALKAQKTQETLYNDDTLVREPIGVCGLITPWNWPIRQVVLKVAPALATGCTCILKPSEFAPLSAALFTDMVHDAGFPAGVFNLVNGEGGTVGAALSQHPDVHMISFTGSTKAGIAIGKAAADTVKRVSLELGSKSPNLLFADCGDALEVRVREAIDGCFLNTGQSCDAPTRLLVERSCYDRVIELAKTIGAEYPVRDPAEQGGHLGPVVNSIQYCRIQEHIQKAINEGSRLLCGGVGKPEGFGKGYYVKPTIFADVTNEMHIARAEVFGPVLAIMPFDTEEEAIHIANDTPYGLAAYLQTGDPKRATRVSAKLQAGMININGGYIQYGSPFGGYKQSGNGREGGMMGLEDYQEVKILSYG